MRTARVLRNLAPALCVAASFAGCISSVPPERLHPSGPITKGPAVDFSGSYCFVSVQESVRTFGKTLRDVPFLGLEAVPDGAEIVVRHLAGESIQFSYLDRNGQRVASEIRLRDSKARWRSGKLVVPPYPVAAGARLGLSKGREESVVYRMLDGRLILGNLSAESGLAFLVVPFRERSEVVVELVPMPADRECPGARPVASGDEPVAPPVPLAPLPIPLDRPSPTSSELAGTVGRSPRLTIRQASPRSPKSLESHPNARG